MVSLTTDLLATHFREWDHEQRNCALRSIATAAMTCTTTMGVGHLTWKLRLVYSAGSATPWDLHRNSTQPAAVYRWRCGPTAPRKKIVSKTTSCPAYTYELRVPVENVVFGLRSALAGYIHLPRVLYKQQLDKEVLQSTDVGPTVWKSLSSALRHSSLSQKTFEWQLKPIFFTVMNTISRPRRGVSAIQALYTSVTIYIRYSKSQMLPRWIQEIR